MPRPQTPLAKAKLTGAIAKNPQRFRDRAAPKTSTQPVGSPPAYLDKYAKAAWRDFVKHSSWFTADDRMALEVASVAVGQMRALIKLGEIVPASMLSAINTAIGKLGASPTDRGKIFQKPEGDEPDDPFAGFDGPTQ